MTRPADRAMRLLNPGPVTLTPRVRNALAGPDLCHREPEFADLQDTIRERLRAVYALDERWAPVVLSGSGTAAVEAMMCSLPGPEARVLIVENGVYGQRMTRMAEIHGLVHERLTLDWGAAIDAAALDARLAQGDYSHIAVVHHETTTGRLNDLALVGRLARAYGARLLVDGVSSFGAEAIDFHNLPIAACAATANKCLHGAPGAAFVLVDRPQLDPSVTRSLYLDLAGACEKQDQRSTPFTPAIPAFYALAEALAEHAEHGGWQARRQRYRALAGRIARGMDAHGIAPLLADTASSCVLRAYVLPAGLNYATLHRRLKQRGFVIYAGQGMLAESICRISPMGALTPADMDRLIEAVGELIAAG